MKLILIPLLSAISCQFIFKPLIEMIRGSWSWKNITAYGGMPSAHSALVSSLATVIGLSQGWYSASFAISLILAIIVITDAIGFRAYLTEHSKTINKLIIDLPDEFEYKYKTLNERISHTLPEVLVGTIIGIVLGFLLFQII